MIIPCTWRVFFNILAFELGIANNPPWYSERKIVMSMREFWPHIRFRNFIGQVNKKGMLLICFPGKQQHVTNGCCCIGFVGFFGGTKLTSWRFLNHLFLYGMY